jgi:hypothetical protein
LSCGFLDNIKKSSINISAFLGGIIENLGGISNDLFEVCGFLGESVDFSLSLSSSKSLGNILEGSLLSLEFSGVSIKLDFAVFSLLGDFSFFLFDDNSLGVQFFFSINEFLALPEGFLLSINDSSGGNFFLDSGLNAGDGSLNFDDEFLQVGDLGGDDFLSGGEEINFLLGGNLKSEVLVL